MKKFICYSLYSILLLIVIWAAFSLQRSDEPSPKSTITLGSDADNPLSIPKPDTQLSSSDQIFPFKAWKTEKLAAVDFVNPPKVFDDGLFSVINPAYRFKGKELTEIIEDGYWYQSALKGARGAVLIGRGNGRPPWSYKVGELHIENNELKLSHRMSFGGGRGVNEHLLLDLTEKETLSKIGVAYGKLHSSPGIPSRFSYSGIYVDGTVISSEEIEKLPFVPLKPNWIVLDQNLAPTEFGEALAKVFWFQFQDGGNKLVQIQN